MVDAEVGCRMLTWDRLGREVAVLCLLFVAYTTVVGVTAPMSYASVVSSPLGNFGLSGGVVFLPILVILRILWLAVVEK